MATGNHLTVRDYFDQALAGRSLRKSGALSQSRTADGNRRFHQLLSSLERKPSNRISSAASGLTIADYLKNPVRPGSIYQASSHCAAENKKSADNLSADSKPAVNSEKRTMQLPSTMASAPSKKQAESKNGQLIEKSIHRAARKYQLPADLIKGVIRAESNFQIDAVSRAGAQGLMQLMPGTARELGVDNPFDIQQNIDGGARYLRKMLDTFGGDVKVALAAYNAGPGTVAKYGGRIPPYQETRQYVNRVLNFSKLSA